MNTGFLKILTAFLLLTLMSCHGKENDAIVDSGFIFQKPWEGQCHSPTIVELSSGDLMAAWFAGSHEGAGDVTIRGSFYDGVKWQKPFVLASGQQTDSTSLPCWNPVLYMSPEKRLFLFYKVGPNPREWWGMVKYSDDDGQTWSDSEKLPEGVLGPIKNKPVNLENGTFLCPSSTESKDNVWKVHLELFNNDGQFLKKINIDHGGSIGVIQPTILKHSADTLQILCRSRQNHIAQSWSFDGGQTWQELSLLNTRNPNSGIDAVALKDGGFLLVYNPLKAGENWWEGRNVLSVGFSYNGVDWQEIAVLEKHESGEYSYPAVIQGALGLIHILYTWDRKKIKHVIIDPKSF